jgi:Protein of unknown function (DUF3987)/Bifunctional DNA primase/polymerase, N-terminal
MFSHPAAAYAGMPTGEVSGISVLDVDPAGAPWAAEHMAKLGRTRTHRTRRKGFHFLFKHRDGVRCSAGKIAEGVDCRGSGGYIIRWDLAGFDLYDESPIGDMPDWLHDEVTRARPAMNAASVLKSPEDLAPPDAATVIDLLRAMPNPAEADRTLYEAVCLATQGAIRGGLALGRLDEEQADAIKDACAEWAAKWNSPRAADFEFERSKWGADWSKRENDISGYRQLLGHAGRLGVDVRPHLAGMVQDEFARAPLPPEVPTVVEAAMGTKFWDPWDKPVPPPFPIDCLPPLLREMVYDTHRRLGSDLGAVAMACLAATAGAADSRNKVQVRRYGSWVENPRLWVMLVGDPSTKKTPTLNAALHPHRIAEAKEMAAYQMAKDLWEKTPKDERGPEPRPPAYLLNDPTPEAAAAILQPWARGSLLYQDELAGWINGMDRYSNGKGGAARAFWLQAYQGGHFRQDRIGRGTVFVENLSVSILGGIQPDRLRSMHDLTDDGLMQRFIPVLMRRATAGEDRPPCPEVEQYNELIRRSLEAPPRSFRLTEAGYRMREAAAEKYQDYAGNEAYGAGFAQFAGKAEALLMRLALTLHLATLERPADVIADETMERAVRLMEYVIRSAAVFYSDWAGAAASADTKALASFVLRRDADQIKLRDLVRGVNCLRDLDERRALERISILVSAGWLAPVGNGYPAKTWAVAPNLRAYFAERRAIERKNKAAMLDLIRQAADERRAERAASRPAFADDGE